MNLENIFHGIDPSVVRGIITIVIAAAVVSITKKFGAKVLDTISKWWRSMKAKLVGILVSSIETEVNLANLTNLDIQQVWSSSKLTVLRLIMENYGFYQNIQEDEKKLQDFADEHEIPKSVPSDEIIPFFYNRLLDRVRVRVFGEPERLGVIFIKMAAPQFFKAPRFGLEHDWFKNLCQDVMSQFIEGEFEVFMESEHTNMLKNRKWEN